MYFCFAFESKSYNARIYQTRYSRRWVYTNFQKDRVIAAMNSETQLCSTLKWYMRCYGAYSSHVQPGTPGPTPSLFDKCTGFFTWVNTQNMGPKALRPIQRTKQWLNILLKDTCVMAWDSNPHSADQKHQSLNSVLLTARPRHFHYQHCRWPPLKSMIYVNIGYHS